MGVRPLVSMPGSSVAGRPSEGNVAVVIIGYGCMVSSYELMNFCLVGGGGGGGA